MNPSEVKERIKKAHLICDDVLDDYNKKVLTKAQMEIRMKMLCEVIEKLGNRLPNENV